ncbi:MAG: sugar kinase [Thaumarchaeota archaeon]|nr:sugar kinase [Nitrososphaerota archaeon]MCL5069082.1 sugar kinase [Nitrososphaerota archaeon]
MLLLSGTVPIADPTITVGPVKYESNSLFVGERQIPPDSLSIGAAAMMAAALKTSQAIASEPPMAVIAGDMGDGMGSRNVYKFLTQDAGGLGASTVTVHYILPLRNEFLEFVEMADYWAKRPFLIADAGALLIAKATNTCEKFDLFTPDAGEISYLADPDAGHPAYVKAALFEVDTTEVPQLVSKAYSAKNAPRYMLVKGPCDYVVENGKIIDAISEPDIPVLEAIGGTGDTITGIVSSLVSSGLEPIRASTIASKANRLAGMLCNPTPATRVFEIVDKIFEAVKLTLDIS